MGSLNARGGLPCAIFIVLRRLNAITHSDHDARLSLIRKKKRNWPERQAGRMGPVRP